MDRATSWCRHSQPRSVYGRYLGKRAVLGALYLFALAGGGAAFACSLSEGTRYGLGYSVWFGGVVTAALGTVIAPFVGARVGGLDYDLGTVKEVHLCGRGVFSEQIWVLGKTIVVGLFLVAAGVLSALVVSTVSGLGDWSWQSTAGLVSPQMTSRLLLAWLVGMPFACLVGWSFAVLVRSGFRGALLVAGTIIVYMAGLQLGRLDLGTDLGTAAALRQVLRFSPWGALLAMTTGSHRHPQVVVVPVLGIVESVLAILAWSAVLLFAVRLSLVRRDIGGGGPS